MRKVDIHDYYRSYLEEAEIESSKAIKLIKENEFDNINLKQIINTEAGNIKTKFGIDVTEYTEYNDLVYDENSTLYETVHKLYIKSGKALEAKDRINLIFVIKLCKNVSRIHKANIRIKLLSNRKTIKFSVFKAYVKRYYNDVQKKVLNGDCYKYDSGCGIYFINRVKNNKGAHYKGRLDYKKTRLNKERIIEEGKIPYCKADADAALLAGIEYKGVKYIEHLREDHLYEFCLTNTQLPKGLYIKFERSDYRGVSLRNISDDEIVYMINSVDDIYKLDGDMRVKLVQLLKYDPSIYVKYIRNKNENKINLW